MELEEPDPMSPSYEISVSGILTDAVRSALPDARLRVRGRSTVLRIEPPPQRGITEIAVALRDRGLVVLEIRAASTTQEPRHADSGGPA